MKTLPRLFPTMVLPVIMACMQTLPARASPAVQEVAYNPAAEEYIRNEILVNGAADLAVPFEDEADRTVRAEFIVGLFKDPELQEIPFLKLYNATIVGDIQANGLSIPFTIEFWFCNFTGRIEMIRTQLRSFNMYNSTVAGSVRLNRAVIDEDLALYESTYGGAVSLFDANIGSNLYAARSHFNGTTPDADIAYPFELWLTNVGQSVEFRSATIKGIAMFENAEFGVDANFENAVFEQTAKFKNFKVGNFAYFTGTVFEADVDFGSTTVERDAYFSNAVFNGEANFKSIRVGNIADFQETNFNGNVIFESSIMDRDADFTGAQFNGEANFDYFAAERFVDLDGTTFQNTFSFVYSTVGWPYFEGATFNGPVNFEGMQASSDFELTNATYNYPKEPFTVNLAKVDGATKFENFSAPAGLRLEHNQFGDLNITGRENSKFHFIDLTATKVDGDLSIENVITDELLGEGAAIADSTTFSHVTVLNQLDMSNASIGFFSMEKFSWPQNSDSFNLRGMTYTDIGLIGQELKNNTWTVLADMVEQSAYSPQAYRTLGEFLTEKGHPDWAAQIELKRKERERDTILDRYSAAWFWSWFLFLFSGYGQQPALAFIWSAVVVLIGAIVFRREEDMVILDTSEAKPPYNPFLYSFALFLPYIDLEVANKWDPKPDRNFAVMYKHIHRLLGWILMPIALLAFGGVFG